MRKIWYKSFFVFLLVIILICFYIRYRANSVVGPVDGLCDFHHPSESNPLIAYCYVDRHSEKGTLTLCIYNNEESEITSTTSISIDCIDPNGYKFSLRQLYTGPPLPPGQETGLGPFGGHQEPIIIPKGTTRSWYICNITLSNMHTQCTIDVV